MSADLLDEMQHKHKSSKCNHRTEDACANPGYPLPWAEVKLLVPLVRRGTGVNDELRVGDDHLERSDARACRAREQVFDVIVRAPEPKERVWRVQRLV